jgi:uncharacterized DUF497 family protein
MRIEWFVWTEHNIDHIARHGVRPEEVDEILEGKYRILATLSNRYLLLGQSVGGRYLTVVFESLGNGQAWVITARDMTNTERRRFLQLL